MATDVLRGVISANDAPIDWAAQVESETRVADDGDETPKRQTWEDKEGVKHIVEVLYADNGDKIKVESTSRVVTKSVPKPIAERKKWKKFGASERDGSGPNPATTYVSDEVKMQFIRNRAGELLLGELNDDEEQARLKLSTQGVAHCRLCKGTDHWSRNCPYKDMINPDGDDEDAGPDGAPAPGVADDVNQRKREVEEKQRSGKYVAPSVRAVASGDRPLAAGPGGMNDRRDENTVRVTNLPEDADEQDLRSLFSTMGRISRIYLAKDKTTGMSKVVIFTPFRLGLHLVLAVRLRVNPGFLASGSGFFSPGPSFFLGLVRVQVFVKNPDQKTGPGS